jgi:hypothetical protein
MKDLISVPEYNETNIIKVLKNVRIIVNGIEREYFIDLKNFLKEFSKYKRIPRSLINKKNINIVKDFLLYFTHNKDFNEAFEKFKYYNFENYISKHNKTFMFKNKKVIIEVIINYIEIREQIISYIKQSSKLDCKNFEMLFIKSSNCEDLNEYLDKKVDYLLSLDLNKYWLEDKKIREGTK